MKISTSITLILFLTIHSSLVCRAHPGKAEIDLDDHLALDDQSHSHGAPQRSPANSQKDSTVKKTCIEEFIDKMCTLLKNYEFRPSDDKRSLINKCTEQVSIIKEWLTKVSNCMAASSQASAVSSTTASSTSTATTTVATTTVATTTTTPRVPAPARLSRNERPLKEEEALTPTAPTTTTAAGQGLRNPPNGLTREEDPPKEGEAITPTRDGTAVTDNTSNTPNSDSQDPPFQKEHPGSAPNVQSAAATVGAVSGSPIHEERGSQSLGSETEIHHESGPGPTSSASLLGAVANVSPGPRPSSNTIGHPVQSGNDHVESSYSHVRQQPSSQDTYNHGSTSEYSQSTNYANGQPQTLPSGTLPQTSQPFNGVPSSAPSGNDGPQRPNTPDRQQPNSQGAYNYGAQSEYSQSTNYANGQPQSSPSGTFPQSSQPSNGVPGSIPFGNNGPQRPNTPAGQQPSSQGTYSHGAQSEYSQSTNYANGQPQTLPSGTLPQTSQPFNGVPSSAPSGNDGPQRPNTPDRQQPNSQGAYNYGAQSEYSQSTNYANGQPQSSPSGTFPQSSQPSNVVPSSAPFGNNGRQWPNTPVGQQSSSQGTYSHGTQSEYSRNTNYANGQPQSSPSGTSPQTSQPSNGQPTSGPFRNNGPQGPNTPDRQQPNPQGAYNYGAQSEYSQSTNYANGQPQALPSGTFPQSSQPSNTPVGQQPSSQGTYSHGAQSEYSQNMHHANGQPQVSPSETFPQTSQPFNGVPSSAPFGNNGRQWSNTPDRQQPSSQGTNNRELQSQSVQNGMFASGAPAVYGNQRAPEFISSGGPQQVSQSQRIERILSIDDIRDLGVTPGKSGEQIFINGNKAAVLAGEFQNGANQVRLHLVDDNSGIVQGKGIILSVPPQDLVRLIGCRGSQVQL